MIRAILIGCFMLPLVTYGQHQGIQEQDRVQKVEPVHYKQDIAVQEQEATGSNGANEVQQLRKKSKQRNSHSLDRDTLGMTHYDLQTNASLGRKVEVYGDGSVSVVWSHGHNDPGFSDRGTGYNHYDGNQWLYEPGNVNRLENWRTGWPNIESFGSGQSSYELILSHIAGDPNLGSGGYAFGTNNGIGDPNFSFNEREANSGPLWWRTASSGDWLHMIGNYSTSSSGPDPVIDGIERPLVYYRSNDRGQTFLDSGVLLPGYADTNKRQLGIADNYAIDAKDNVVAIVLAENIRQLTLWKSTDYGATWSMQEIESIGLDFHTYQNGVWNMDTVNGTIVVGSDTFNGDQVTTVIDKNGTVHVSYNTIKAYRDESMQDPGRYFYRPYINGIKYWNDANFGQPVFVGGTPTIDSVTDLSYTGSTDDRYPYSSPISSRPTIAHGGADTLYVVYEAMVANTGADGNLYDYRDLYLAYSIDGGNSWSSPVNITKTAGNYGESVYPSLHKEMVNDKLHLAWQEDEYPDEYASGSSESFQQFETENRINYMAVEKGWIFQPVRAGFTTSKDGYTVNFTDTSWKANQWIWTFGDDSTATVQNPTHTYQDTGNYEVCLIAEGNGESDTACKMVNIECPEVTSDFNFTIEPNDTTVNFTNQSTGAGNLEWAFGDGTSDTNQNPTHVYDTGGVYSVCLTITNDCGNSDSACQMVNIECPDVTADFSIDEDGPEIQGTYMGVNGDQVIWQFGDGTSDTGESVTHTYEEDDTYEVCVNALSDCGNEANQCTNIEIQGSSRNFAQGNEDALKVYPNPVTSKVHFEAPKYLTDFHYEVYNATGELQRKGQLNREKSNLSLEMGALSEGVYWIKVNSGTKQWIKKVVVNR